MSLDFLERMRKRQKERHDREGRIEKKVLYIETEQGVLLDHNGEPYPFYYNQYADNSQVAIEFNRVRAITAKIDQGGMGLIFPESMLNYYLDIPTLEPV